MDQITKSYRDADAIDGSNQQIAARCKCDQIMIKFLNGDADIDGLKRDLKSITYLNCIRKNLNRVLVLSSVEHRGHFSDPDPVKIRPDPDPFFSFTK